MNSTSAIGALLLLLGIPSAFAVGADSALLRADRAVIERVYHEHRTGTKEPFEKAMPETLLHRIVRDDAKKEAVLARAYGVRITEEMVAAEVTRINTTTRAPEVLKEIKAALGHDAARFARSMARPIVVDRALRACFENDDTLHALQRRVAEKARDSWIAKQTVAGSHDVTWQLTPRPAEQKDEQSATGLSQVSASGKSASYSVEATAQIAQVLASPDADVHGQTKLYFEDLDPQLQQVLRVQLQTPGDVSAVIEMPANFLVFQIREKTATSLTATRLAIPKRGYDEWLAQQPE